MRTFDFLLANNILYTLSSRGDNVYLSVLSSHKCSLLARREQQDITSALIYQVKLPSHERVRKILPLLSQHEVDTAGYKATIFTQCLIITRYVFINDELLSSTPIGVVFGQATKPGYNQRK